MSPSQKITVFFKESNKSMELERGKTGKDLANLLHLNGPHQALAIEINNRIMDLTNPLEDGDSVSFLNFSQKEGREIFWHSSAHILAQAVTRLYPQALPTIGPCVEGGFYYDFANLTISEEDFPAIEKEVKTIVSKNFHTEREEFSGKNEACSAFSTNKYKVEMIQDMEEGSCISAYRQGEFFDLCRGPHLPNLGKVKAFKILKTSGAYWRGDSQNEMLTRIYAVSFPDKALLKEHLQRLEEAKKRDHKVIGPKLNLFSTKEEAPGMPFIHPKGMVLWKALMDFWSKLHKREGYEEIKTPIILSRKLWETSGHWDNYQSNMYTCSIDEQDYAIKPMNCPGCMLYFKSNTVSYRKLPLKIAEIGTVHRNEASGAIGGLMRVRSFHQDDAHLFLEPSQIEDEVLKVIHLADELYSTFGLDYHLELSTRPENNTIGSDEDWELSTTALRKALTRSGKEFRINEGDGAFYGPKIDFHLKDAIGRTWQCGTIQLDMALPQRFELEYTAQDGSRRQPVMLHRAIYGSIERFLGILIEHFSGRFPLWLSPRQICILTVADRHQEKAKQVFQTLKNAGFHCDIDDSDQSVSKKVRTAQLLQYNYMLTIGDKELENKTISLRSRDNIVIAGIELEHFLAKIQVERETKSLLSTLVKQE